ncbi:ABC transporter substrate-binding protein [Streptomonospora nanhaiensis]|uniref:ABC transporter substrate-binding protein n=1 Tax=Streptomonospora nanhaiensis TaxID=1323731 RepID=A0ABY6YSX1_9ACTN|nr:ABC transporter substrate-binding protein [Streptomonospora nanhaiensis]WAE75303.1 ABC transporter substrate-binding protein [Streptomonospora nanhaiensis]
MTRPVPTRTLLTGTALVAALALTSCAGPPAAGPSGSPTRIVLADAQPLGGYDPVDGYGELGVSPVFEGLLRPESTGDDRLPDLAPALAAAPPEPNGDSTVWDVELRTDVVFSDGSALDADDVVATYSAVLDPATASEIAASYSMIESVTATGDHSVRFTLHHPYYAFPARMSLGITPEEEITPGPAADSGRNRRPVGTGPYVLAELDAEQAVFEANPHYHGTAPQVTELVTLYLPDDNTRAQRMRAGGVDGTVLPPTAAATFAGADGVDVLSVRTADWRGLSLPAENAFASDGAARLAMNLAVDRDGIIEHVLAGHGRPAHTPVAEVYGEAHEPEAVFDHDPDEAARLLDGAGWREGPDGIRERDGDRAAFTLYYLASDSLRRDLATAFAAEMLPLGIEVDVRGGTWDDMGSHTADAAILLGGGDKPYDLDTQVYATLHTREEGTPTFENPGDLAVPGVDEALEDARRSPDAAERAELYREVQRAYVEHPTYVFLAFADHTYVSAENDWDSGPLVLEPHAHGVSWGPWWNLAGWRR